MIDPNDELLHRVRRNKIDRYVAFLDTTITASCGKTWSPKLPMDLNKPECRECFPVPSLFTIAA